MEEFEIILAKVEPEWQKQVITKYKRKGRDYKLEVSEMILMMLLYYRSYVTQIFIGHMFGIDDSRVCRILKKLEPILGSVMAIKKCHQLNPEEIKILLIDATEQTIERPKKDQKKYYSGKKKCHTVKTEICVTPAGRIVNISATHPGSNHDFKVFKTNLSIPPSSKVYVDSGYQGIKELHAHSELPYKSSKNNPLDDAKKNHNAALSKIRVTVEHIFGDMKVFKILSYRYRNALDHYDVKFNIIAGIINLKNNFLPV